MAVLAITAAAPISIASQAWEGLSDTGVYDNRQIDLVNEDLDKFPGTQAFIGTDGRSQRHDAGGACLYQISGHIQIRNI